MLNVLMFYLVNIAGYSLAFFRLPIFAFTLYQAIYFFHPEKRWWGSMIPDISYSFFTVLLMAIVLAINFKESKSNKLLQTPQFKWMYIVLFIYSITYFYAVFPELHYLAINYFFKLIIIMSIAYKLCDSDEKLNYALYGYIFGAWYVSFYAWQIGRNSGSRVENIGTVDAPDSNGLAAAITPSLVLCLYYFWTHNKKVIKLMFILAGIFIANAIVLINSRGAFLGAAISIGFFMYYMYTSSFQRKHQKKMAVFLTVCGLAGAGYLADDSFKQRMFTIAGETEVDTTKESGGTRTIFWKAAWDMAKDHPFGNGYRGFNYYAPLYIPENVETGGKKSRSVHSTWFEVLSETGYLGLLAFFMMVYSSYKTLNMCKKALKERKQIDEYFKVIALQAMLISFLVGMTFLNRMRAEILYWCILYSACAYNIYVLKFLPNETKTKHG
jgi:hypothetical protein